MHTSPPAADLPEPEKGDRVTLLQEGRKTRTTNSFKDGQYERRVAALGDARDLGEFESVEAAAATAIRALESDPKAVFMVIGSDGRVLAIKLNREVQQALEFKKGLAIKAVLFLVCALVPGIVFYLNAEQPSVTDTALLVTFIYALCWLFGFTQNVVEAGVIACILMTVISLSFPIRDAISKAVRKHQEQRALPAPR
ncbi:hypothetical protein GCM10023213_31550 [Prosthecobacter algae]|uniref:Roadblock/LAMTOR2 domain-containing protein n=1 Tax=Prosthecobacter algae TaxID=1144682 RepID=A0ABP9PE90_9BACT